MFPEKCKMSLERTKGLTVGIFRALLRTFVFILRVIGHHFRYANVGLCACICLCVSEKERGRNSERKSWSECALTRSFWVLYAAWMGKVREVW